MLKVYSFWSFYFICFYNMKMVVCRRVALIKKKNENDGNIYTEYNNGG